jgi:hypothetical protein
LYQSFKIIYDFFNRKMESRSRSEKKFESERWRSPSPDTHSDARSDIDTRGQSASKPPKKYFVYDIESVDYLSPSQSKKFTIHNIFNGESGLKVIENFKPSDTIKIGNLRFNMILRKDNESVWEDLYDYFTTNTKDLCKGYLGNKYIRSNYENKANLIVYCSLHDPLLYEETGVDMLVGVFIADYTPEIAHIIATCFFYDAAPKGGLLLRCMGLSVLSKMGYKDSYTEAINGKLVKYYSKIGYRLGNTLCGEEDRFVDMYEKGVPLDEIMIIMEEDAPTSEWLGGWKMKWCNYDEKNICKEALDGVLSSVLA